MIKHLVLVGLITIFAGSMNADPIAYAGLGGGNFGTIDLATGAFTQLGTLGQTPAGLGVFDGTLYAESYNSTGTLYSVNPANGALTPIGNSGTFFVGGFGSTLNGLYGVGNTAGDPSLDLFSIDPSNGTSTDLGPTGIGLGVWRDISTNSSTLYFGDTTNLYSLNLTNGSASLIGPFGGNTEIGALVTMDGILYGGDEGNLTIDTVDTGTGAATVIPGSSASDVWGLAPDPLSTSATPEPATWSLLGVSLAALVLSSSRRNQNRQA
jgi:hypothetical protein